MRVGCRRWAAAVPDELATDPEWQLSDDVAWRAERVVGNGAVGLGTIALEEAVFACPLTVKDLPAGVLLTRRPAGFSERDRSLFASLASQLSMGMENARLYHQLDGLFRQYMSPDVATALLADPDQAALAAPSSGDSAVRDLRGFTTFSERSTPEQIVEMLNATSRRHAAILPRRHVVQFVGDALMALFGAPARRTTTGAGGPRGPAMQAAVEAIAASSPGWPRFRVGINTGPSLSQHRQHALRSFNAMGVR